ncbi:MAG TPA: putative 2-aminoethylphosphonate ABC transporter ATP-binding protein [Kiloniellales bacterium]
MGGNGGTGQAPFLRIRNLTKKFGDFTALEDISLDVFEGEFVCFLGPSGCGKTTLLRAIAGLDIQTSGAVEQEGRDISALPPSERDFGIVFQSYALFPNLTVRKNVAYGLENRKLPKREIAKRVDELLDLVGLPNQGHKYPAQLSGGEQQRVALARAMATSPGLLLLDEPLSALDAKVRVHLRHEVKDLQRRLGVTTIMVTHDQEEALTMADRIVVMNHGVIEQVGTPEEIYGRPATAFVADFIGTMNFLDGMVETQDTVAVGNAVLHCETDGMAPGTSVTVAIRPEDINAQDISEGDDNVVDVEIVNLEFLGSFYRADIGGPAIGGQEVRADFSINLVRRKNLEAGSKLPLRFPPKFIRIYRDASARFGEL